MNIRLQCAQILCRIIEEKKFFSTIKDSLHEKNLAFANMLVLTVLRNMLPLNVLISKHLKHKISGKDIILRYLLLCGAAEILFMNTPVYAAANEYVSLAKKCTNRFAAGMVNAILRKIATEKEIPQDIFPTSFIDILKPDYGKEDIQKMQQAVLNEPPLDITPKENPAFWAEKLQGKLLSSGTIRLEKPAVPIAALAGFAEGAWWVQDAASALPVLMLGNIKGKKVLDLCAAPGGKTAQLLSKGAKVTAVDIDDMRLQRLIENIKRLKMSENLNTIHADALKFLEEQSETFDIILIDAPCSATGTFRRHPEVMHLKTLNDVQAQQKIQEKLLDLAARKLKKDGEILYCTCSLTHLEGEKQIEVFLQQHQNFTLKPPTAKDLNICEGILLEKNIFDKQVLRTLPYNMFDLGGMDGFFAARLTKND